MGKLAAVISCLVLTVAAVTEQTAAQSQTSERPLPQWLTGMIAVVAFLLLAFVSVLVKKAWCEDSSRRRSAEESLRENELVMTNRNLQDTELDSVRSKGDSHAYVNMVIDSSDDRVTPM